MQVFFSKKRALATRPYSHHFFFDKKFANTDKFLYLCISI